MTGNRMSSLTFVHVGDGSGCILEGHPEGKALLLTFSVCEPHFTHASATTRYPPPIKIPFPIRILLFLVQKQEKKQIGQYISQTFFFKKSEIEYVLSDLKGCDKPTVELFNCISCLFFTTAAFGSSFSICVTAEAHISCQETC